MMAPSAHSHLKAPEIQSMRRDPSVHEGIAPLAKTCCKAACCCCLSVADVVSDTVQNIGDVACLEACFKGDSICTSEKIGCMAEWSAWKDICGGMGDACSTVADCISNVLTGAC